MKHQRPLSYQTEQAIFATRLREYMKLRRVNQEMLAAYVGVRRQTISLYTTGQSKPDVEILAKIAVYLEVSADYLLGLTDDPGRIPTAVDELGLTVRAVENLKSISAQDNDCPPLMKAVNALIGSRRFIDVVNDLSTYWFGKGVIIRQPSGERLFIPIESARDFMEFIRPSCLSRIQESVVMIKVDIDNRPEFDLSTKVNQEKKDN